MLGTGVRRHPGRRNVAIDRGEGDNSTAAEAARCRGMTRTPANMRARFLGGHRLGDSPQDQHGATDVDRDCLVEDVGLDVVHGGAGEVAYLRIPISVKRRKRGVGKELTPAQCTQ